MSRNKEYVRITVHKPQADLDLSEPGQIRAMTMKTSIDERYNPTTLSTER